MTDDEPRNPHACPHCVFASPVPRNSSSPRTCAFNADGSWFHDNWCCATMEVLRAAAYEKDDSVRWGDESIALVVHPGAANDAEYTHVVMCFYKDRGCTRRAYMMNSSNELVPLTLDVASEYANILLRNLPSLRSYL